MTAITILLTTTSRLSIVVSPFVLIMPLYLQYVVTDPGEHELKLAASAERCWFYRAELAVIAPVCGTMEHGQAVGNGAPPLAPHTSLSQPQHAEESEVDEAEGSVDEESTDPSSTWPSTTPQSAQTHHTPPSAQTHHTPPSAQPAHHTPPSAQSSTHSADSDQSAQRGTKGSLSYNRVFQEKKLAILEKSAANFNEVCNLMKDKLTKKAS